MILISFKRDRFPPEIIQHAVWLYARFSLSFRDVEDLLAERGIDVSNETLRRWFLKFGRLIAGNLRRSRPRASARSHLDEMVIKIRGRKHWLWRAVDDEGDVLEVFATKRWNRKAALAFLKRAMKRYGQPRAIVTDRLKSYRAAMNVIGNAADQECDLWLNNRAENSHQPFRRREGAMSKFRDVKTLQKFAAVHASIHNHFNLDRKLTRRDEFKQNRSAALAEWCQLAA